MKKSEIVISTLSIIFMCIFPSIFLYSRNVGEAEIYEIFMPILVLLIVAVGVFIIINFIIKDVINSTFCTLVFIMIFSNFTIIEKIFKTVFSNLKYWHIIEILLFIFINLVIFIYNKNNNKIIMQMDKVFCIIFGGLVIFNLILATPNIIKKISAKPENISVESTTQQDNKSSYPNFYYILLDEYSSFSSIKKYYDYDNSEFYNFLKDLNFNISTNSHNDSIDTITITTNILNLDYVISDEDDLLRAEKMKYRENPPMFNIPFENGYEINNYSEIVSWDGEYGNIPDSYNSIFGDFTKMVLDNTVLYPLLVAKDEIVERKNTLILLDCLEQTYESHESSVFTYAHLNIPHAPFVFDENGNMTNFSKLNDWKDKSCYLGQYIYTTDRIEKIVKNIITNDPDSIIVLQSDHSARWTQDQNGNEIVSNEDARSVLNAVYYKGEQIDIEGLTNVNTMRYIFSHLFGLNLPEIEVDF